MLGLSLSVPRAQANTVTHAFPIRGLHSYGGELSRYGYARGRLHRGQDMAADSGTPLLAVTSGRVSYRQYQHDGAGHYVVIKGDDGRDTVHMHLQRAAFVAPGERVRKGQLIGRVGSTGSSTGPHLHFETWTRHWYDGGEAYDPLPLLREWDIPLTPSQLAAQEGSDRVTLDWADNPSEGDLAGYRIYRRTPDTNYARIASTSTSSYVDREDRPNTTYYYRVKAVDRLSNLSASSNYASTGEKVAAAVYQQTVDNANQERFAASASWSRSTWNTQRVGADYRYARPEAVNDNARFRLRVPRTGRYAVFVWYPSGSTYSSGAPFGVLTTDGIRWRKVDQRTGGGRWVSLGVHPLAAGDRNSVFVGRRTSAPGWVIADAVRIVEYR